MRYWETYPPAPGLFINYRYVDLNVATHIDELLVSHYSPEAIFRADRSIKSGERFSAVLTNAAIRASVMLVIIGHNWAQSLADGRHDWCLLELRQAHENTIPFLPVYLTRRHNADPGPIWHPVERRIESLKSEDLIDEIPQTILTAKSANFGTVDPARDIKKIIEVVDSLVTLA